MMQNKEYAEWERRIYERRKTRNEQRLLRRYRLCFWLSVAAWAVLLVWLLTVPAKSQEVVEAEPVIVKVEADAGRLPGDDVPAVEYASIEAMPLQYIGEFTMTHYCPCERCCGRWSDGITATGTKATEGRTIAVDPSVIPYGTEVEVWYEDGSKARYIAEDCGSAIVGNRIDVFMNNHDEALDKGVLPGSVYVVEVES